MPQFSALHLNGRSWRLWALCTAMLLAVYLAAWPLVWRLILAPNASSREHGLRVEVSTLADHGGQHPRSLLAGPRDLRLDDPRTTARGVGIWQVPKSGVYCLRLQANDYACLYLDRRLLIDQPREVSSLNQTEALVFLEAGLHFLQMDLTNLEGQGWLRLALRPPEAEDWQDLPLEQLRPPDLGNWDFWLGLVGWLEGLCLWGLWGAFLAAPLLVLRRLARSPAGEASPSLPAKMLSGLALVFLGLPAVLALARRWPAAYDLPWLSTYSPDLRFQALGLLTYALCIGVVVFLVVPTWRRRLSWCGLLLGLVATRVYAWPYSIHSGLHPDWTSFAGFFEKFSDLFARHHLDHQADLTGLLSYLADVLGNLYVGYPSGCFSFPAFMMGVGGMAAQTALSGTGAQTGFHVVGHLLGPAFNLAYALLLARLGRRYLWPDSGDGWSWCLVLLLALLPTHVYLGANITYNLLADALHLALLLAGLGLMAAWQAILADDECGTLPAGWRLALRPLLAPGLLLGLLLGLCLATKLVFLPALVTLLIYAGVLMWRHRRGRPGLVWAALPGSLLAAMLLGAVVYGLIIIRNVLNMPGFWQQMLAMTGDNTGLSLSKVGLLECLRIFFQDLLRPNLGYVGSLAGGLGLALWGWRALAGRDLSGSMVFLWALLTLAMNLLSWSMLMMFNAMPRSSMALGLWLALALYLVKSLWDWAAPSLSRRAGAWLRAGLVCALGLELALAGTSLLVMYGYGGPRFQTEGFLATLAGSPKTVASVMYIGYGDDPNTVLGHQVVFKDLRRRARDLSGEDNCRRIIAETQADYWLLTSYEAFFLGRHQSDAQALRQALAQDGYGLECRYQSRPFAGHPWLDGVYQHFLRPLLGGPSQGGLQEPAYVEVYAKGFREKMHAPVEAGD
jgi:hypothetical protein